jgi:hypothetical protein
MPAVSKKQQRFMGMVHAVQAGSLDPKDVSTDVRAAARTMKPSDVKAFAETKHKGLPMKKAEYLFAKLSGNLEQAHASKEYIRKRLADEVKLHPNEYVAPASHIEKNANIGKYFRSGIGRAKRIMTGETARNMGIGFTAGTIASNIASAITYPVDTVNVREQTGQPPAKGFLELYKGFGTKMLKNTLTLGTTFALHDPIKKLITKKLIVKT